MTAIKNSDVFPLLEKSILADGFDVVMDFEKSKGAHFYDAKHQKTYIDFFSFFASNPIGYNHPKMSDPEFEKDLLAASKIKVSNSDIYSKYLADFTQTLHHNFLSKFDRLFFIEGGALGVENAIKTAQDWKVRKNLAANRGENGTQVLHFAKAFHGRTGYTLSLTNTVANKTAYFAKFDWPRVSNPKIQFPLTEESLAKVIEAENKTVQEIKQAFQSRPHEICSILIETIQGEGGDNFFRKEFLQKLKELSLENDALLIFDEVQTGMGITGKNWAHEHYDVVPDLMAFGKKVQVCGFAARLERLEEVDHVFKVSSRINSTWGGGLSDMARSTQFMKIILEERLVDNAQDLGKKMLGQLDELSNENEKITNVRGLGLWMAFDLPSADLRDQAIDKLWENGLMILPCGEKSIRLRPVLDLKASEADEGLSIIKKTLSQP